MSKRRVIVDPAFRRMGEIFDDQSLDRLDRMAEIVWARDEPMPTDVFLEAVADADAVVFGEWRHGQAGLEAAAPELVALLEVAGGHEHIELDYRSAIEREIHVGSCAPAFGPAVAEMGLALALAARRGVVAADRAMRSRREHWLHRGNVGNSTLFGSTVGFIGCGGISRHLQDLLGPFDVTIRGYDPPLPVSQLHDRGIEPTDLASMFERCDLMFVLAAPTPTNRGLVSAELLERLTEDQTLVVLSRASLVDFDTMTRLSGQGRFRVATDVYPDEPISSTHPIRDNANAVIVPHLAGALEDALLAIGRSVVDDLDAIFDGRVPQQMQYLDATNTGALLQTGQPPPTR